MTQGRIVVASGNRLRHDEREVFAQDSYTAAPSETMLSVSGLLMRVAVVSALVLTVLIAANVAMLRVLG
jgi:hypothetical protein